MSVILFLDSNWELRWGNFLSPFCNDMNVTNARVNLLLVKIKLSYERNIE